MSPEIFFQIIVNGLFTGGIYALVAVGLTLMIEMNGMLT